MTKAKISPTPTKAKTGTVAKRKLFRPVTIIAAFSVLFVLSILGYFGYLKYTEHSMKAKAASWSYVGTYYGSTNATNAYACKTRVDSPFGPVYKVQVLYSSVNPVNPGSWAAAASYRSGNTVNTSRSSSWWGGKIMVITVYASVLNGDTVGGTVSYSSEVERPNFFNANPANLTNC